MPKDNKEYDPYSTSSGEIGGHHKSKNKQEVQVGKSNLSKFVTGESVPSLANSTTPKRPEGSFAQFVTGESGPSYVNASYEDLSHLINLNPVGTSKFFNKERRPTINGEASLEKIRVEQEGNRPSTSVRVRDATATSLAAVPHSFIGMSGK
jgi:hypothetical protein